MGSSVYYANLDRQNGLGRKNGHVGADDNQSMDDLMSMFSDDTFAGNNDRGIKGGRKIQKFESRETAETEEPDFLKQ